MSDGTLQINGKCLDITGANWIDGANLHLLFWLSWIPVATKWVGQDHQASLPASVYGMASPGAGVAYALLVRMIIRVNGRKSPRPAGLSGSRRRLPPRSR